MVMVSSFCTVLQLMWFVKIKYLSIDVRPTIIPLQAYGVVDPGVSDINDSEILAHAMQNATGESVEMYYVQHGSDFVNEYPQCSSNGQFIGGDIEDPNHLYGAFPCLFPFGCGGFEVDRPRKVSLVSD